MTSLIWEERKYTKWSKKKLSELLSSVHVTDRSGKVSASICGVKVEGECNLCFSSGKKLGLFELSVVCEWKDGSSESKECGELSIPQLVTEDVTTDEYEIKVTATNAAGPATQLMRTDGVKEVRRVIHTFVEKLLEGKGGDGALATAERRAEDSRVPRRVVESATLKAQNAIHKKNWTAQNTKIHRKGMSPVTARPERAVEFSCTVADTGMDNMKAEPHKFYFSKTFLETDTVEKVKEEVRMSIVSRGWKPLLFRCVVLMGPLVVPGGDGDGNSTSEDRQINIMGAMRGFNRRRGGKKVCLSGKKQLRDVLQSLNGNSLRISPLEASEAFEAANKLNEAEIHEYLQKQEEKRIRREERRRKKLEKEKEKELDNILKGKTKPTVIPNENEIYNWGEHTIDNDDDIIPASGHTIEIMKENEDTTASTEERFETLMLE
eukprot:g5398.t1